jgi:hypothetical protein
VAFGKGGRIEDDRVERLARVGPVAKDLEGVGLNPVHLSGDDGAVGLEVALGHFERGAGGVDAVTWRQTWARVQSKAALVAADVERAAAPVGPALKLKPSAPSSAAAA